MVSEVGFEPTPSYEDQKTPRLRTPSDKDYTVSPMSHPRDLELVEKINLRFMDDYAYMEAELVDESESNFVLVVAECVCIPPNTASRVKVRCDSISQTEQREWAIVPKISVGLKYGIVVEQSVVDTPEFSLYVINITDEIVTLMIGLRIADVVKAKRVELPSTDISAATVVTTQGQAEAKDFDENHFDINPKLKQRDREALIEVLRKNWDRFAFSNNELGCTNIIEHSIDTGEAKPIRQRLWTRYSEAENEFISQQIQEMLSCGVIERCYTPWACNVVLAPKKDGKWRFACDYRELNKVTQYYNYPLPRIADVIDSLAGSAWFSKLDLLSGYWQVKMKESDGSDLKTGFVVKDGIFIFKRLPFGVRNGPQDFQALMDKIFSDMRKSTANYMDDLTPHAKTITEHNAVLDEVFRRLREAGLKVKISKCSFLYDEIKYLGFIVNGQGIRPDPKKVDCIVRMPVPKTLKELRSFMGMVTYYKRFVPKLAFMAQPLFEMLAITKMSTWTEKQTESFETIKKTLLSTELLVHRDESLPIELHTDASDNAVAAILVQIHTTKTATGKPKREERPLQYASRTLTGPERKWSIPEKEALALMFGLTIFRPYLAMRKFVVRTDHLALLYLQNLKDPIKTRIGRWALKLQEFDCKIEYRPGPKNVVADALSRNCFEKPLKTKDILEVPTFSVERTHKSEVCTEQQSRDLEHFEMGQLGIDILQYQLIDEFCREILVHLEEMPNFRMINDGLYHVKEGRRPRVVIPLVLRAILIELYHASRFSAHLGRNKTIATMTNRFYWKNMHKDIESYINRCLQCKVHKLPNKKRPGLLKSINPFRTDWKVTPGTFLSADLLGPFPESVNGNKMVIVVSDILTRYVIVGALRNGTAEEVADFLVNKVICIYGAFRVLLTDCGNCFKSKLMRELSKLLNFQQKFTTPYTPEINGLTERFNKTLATMLRPFMEAGKFTEWDKNLAAVTFAYNTSVQESIREIPYFLTFGRDPILPMDIALNLPSASLSADSLSMRMQKAFEQAAIKLGVAQERQKKHFDYARAIPKVRIGDIVLYEVPTRRKGEPDKLQPRTRGPYRVIGKLGEHTFVIENFDIHKPKREIVGVRRLIPLEQNENLTGDEAMEIEHTNETIHVADDHNEVIETPESETIIQEGGGDSQPTPQISETIAKRKRGRPRKGRTARQRVEQVDGDYQEPKVQTANPIVNADEPRRSARIRERLLGVNCILLDTETEF